MYVARSLHVSLDMSLGRKFETSMHKIVQSANALNMSCGIMLSILASILLLKPTYISWISVFTLLTFDSIWLVLKMYGDYIANGLLLVGALMIIHSRVNSTVNRHNTKHILLMQIASACALAFSLQQVRNLLHEANKSVRYTMSVYLIEGDQIVLDEIHRLLFALYKSCDPILDNFSIQRKRYSTPCKNTQLHWFSIFMETCDFKFLKASSIHSAMVSGCGLKVMEKLESSSLLLMDSLQMLLYVTITWTMISCCMVLYRMTARSSYREITSPISKPNAFSVNRQNLSNSATCQIIMSGNRNIQCATHQSMNVFQAVPTVISVEDMRKSALLI
uniref:AlNc14C56G4271 protein n=1 Tax=Albugo laibachii Nc14 TaxID=890382 RepID=F0WC88_9STRA|nr:AlNc14C56G4271 [Albugo laibachii Nc14]|eukprot:CCA18801.1 AlNc14C56G4271 [Albugo laibachii Nc14]